MKICTKCRKSKELFEFGRRSKTKDELSLQCKSCCREYDEKNKEKAAIRYAKNKKKRQITQSIYREKNRSKKAAYDVAYNEIKFKRDRGKRASYTANYRAAKLQRTLPGLTIEQKKMIQIFYTEAAKITKETGIPHHVDHIVPLRGKKISGLHVPWNLQILVGAGPKGNLSKGNKYE